MADKADDSLYPIAVLIDELKNEDIQVSNEMFCNNIVTLIDGLILVTAPFKLN